MLIFKKQPFFLFFVNDNLLIEKQNITALANLLDDPDQIIYDEIKKKLIEIGPSCVPYLEKIIFENTLGDVFKSRANELINHINLNQFLVNHRYWLKNPFNLIDGVMDIDQFFFPNVTRNYIEHEINEMVKDIKSDINNSMNPIEKVKVINDVIFDVYKVFGDKKDYHNPENSSFGSLIKNKKGNPLTISILYVEVARKLGIPIKGINLPNHFIVGYLKNEKLNFHLSINQYVKDDIMFYINPFSKGVILRHSDIENFIKEINITYKHYYFVPCKFRDITKRILTNLTYSYRNSKNKKIISDLKKILALYD